MEKPTLNEWMDYAVRTGKGWKVTWEFSNNHVWHQTFLTEAEALAFVERSIDNDPNVLSWVIIEEALHKKDE
jgi:hypothetical protein